MHDTVVRPAHLWVPERRGSYVDEVRDVARLIGRPLDASQDIAVDALTSYGPRGAWLALETGLKIPRQNGKTAGIETPIVLTDLFVWDADRIAWTAHLFKTAREAFEDHVRLIQSTPEFDRRVARIRYANGEEGIELVSGARLDYLARSKGGGRGLGGKRVVVDEALFFGAEAAGALLPILAARENPQVNYLSSACKVESDQLRALTRRGRAGGDPSLIWVEWCAAGSFADPGCAVPRCLHFLGTPGCVLDDFELLVAANPALSAGRVSREFLEAMRRTLPPTEFAREFLGWDEESDEDVDTIPIEAWAARVDQGSRVAPGARPVFAVDVSPNSRSAAIAVAGRREDGARHVGLVEHRAGVSWVVPRLVDMIARRDPVAVILDGASPAAALLPSLHDEGLRVRSADDPGGLLVVTTATQMGAACVGLLNAVESTDPVVWHRGDPIVTGAWAAAAKRDIGDGLWGLTRKRSDGDISPAVAVVLAHYGHAVHGEADYDLMGSFG